MSRPKGSKNKPKIVLAYENKKTGKINSTIPQIKKGLKRGYKVEDEVETENVEKESVETKEITTVKTNPVEITPTEITPTEIDTILPEPKIGTKKSTKTYTRCERCGDEIYCEPRRIDTNLLTGMADFHRATPRYVKLCDKCCKQLNDIVDDWLLKGKCGNELKKKGWI